VVCLGVIQHTPDPEKTIKCLFEKVKPGGVLVIDHYIWRIGYYSTLTPIFRAILNFMICAILYSISFRIYKFLKVVNHN
jgi:2-polyprenyl-3-methyl-5-hydroxy-6-metoxy-1,4-benzoquinol methylase